MDGRRHGGRDAGRSCRAAAAAVTGISIDSRTIKPGEAYFAIRGDNHDGHDFVDAALRRRRRARRGGAGPPQSEYVQAPLLIVDDVSAPCANSPARRGRAPAPRSWR